MIAFAIAEFLEPLTWQIKEADSLRLTKWAISGVKDYQESPE